AHLAAVMHRSTDVAIFYDGDGTIAWVSPACKDVFGMRPEELIGRNGFDLIHEDDVARVADELLRGRADGTSSVRVEFRINDPSGQVRWVEEIATDLTVDQDIGYVVGNLRDITERKTFEDALARRALVDDLTGLPNMHALVEAIDDEGAADGAAGAVGLALFDLDDFCDVNDTLGHDHGDALLRVIARRVRDAVPDEFMVARSDGDQFAILGSFRSGGAAVHEIASIVRSALADGIRLGEHELVVSASIGVAVTQDGRTAGLIRDADAALAHAKRTDRGGTVVFRPQLANEASRRLSRTSDLRRAITQREIVPLYQPVIELSSGRVVAVEALARWYHADHGWIGPDEFIQLAETSGLIEELGGQIIEQFCADAAQWLRQGRRLQLAVNASGVQLSRRSFVTMVEAALATAGLPPSQLTIEITETAAVREPATARSVLGELHDREVVLSLDDFGTGYSPLASLRDLPVSSIKLDRSFVAGLGSATGDMLVAGIVQLGLTAGMEVVAEGVETRAQAEQLMDFGCQHGQGYVWSPAVPSSDLLATVELIERRSRLLSRDPSHRRRPVGEERSGVEGPVDQ
ncbi:MAG: putative bifunctional diguanylate cyclase/phosphodiesterase, partial [Microthrixaceae bacterium]